MAHGSPAGVVHTWPCWQRGVPGALGPHSSPLLPLSFGDFLPVVALLLWTPGLAVASTPWNKTVCLIFVLKGLAMSSRSQGMAWEGQPC